MGVSIFTEVDCILKVLFSYAEYTNACEYLKAIF